jgi:hypothetical protein
MSIRSIFAWVRPARMQLNEVTIGFGIEPTGRPFVQYDPRRARARRSFYLFEKFVGMMA